MLFLSLASGWTSFLYSKCITSGSITQADAILEALKGSLIVGTETAPVDVFNTVVLSSDATQTGVTLSGVEGTEFVLVLLPFEHPKFMLIKIIVRFLGSH